MQSTIGVMWLSYKKQYVTSRSCYRWKDCWGWKRKVFPSWQLSSLFPLLSLSFQAPHFSFFPPVCFFVGIDLLILKGQCWCVLSHFGHIWLCNLVDCSPRDSSVLGKNTGVACLALLQEIFPKQGSNRVSRLILHYRHILYLWAAREAQLPCVFLSKLGLSAAFG